MSIHTNCFSWHPLDLWRKADREREPLTCELTKFDLNDPPEYHALSCRWANSSSNIPLECDGRGLQITLNLSQALFGVRDTLHPIMLWVDAVCISQSDILEKNQR